MCVQDTTILDPQALTSRTGLMAVMDQSNYIVPKFSEAKRLYIFFNQHLLKCKDSINVFRLSCTGDNIITPQ
jgi:hypothetical protein